MDLKKRIDGKTLKELEANYDKKLIRQVLCALQFFEVLEKGPAIDLTRLGEDKIKAVQYFKKKYQKIIRAVDMMLEKPATLNGLETASVLNETEKEIILQIKTRCENDIKQLPSINKKAVDRFAVTLFGFLSEDGPYSSRRERQHAFLSHMPVFQMPASRPKKIVENALLIVIFSLLKKNEAADSGKGKQIKWLYILTVDIVNVYFGKNLTPKAVDNALHSSS